MKCDYCGRPIRRNTRFRWYRMSDGTKVPQHIKCNDWVLGRYEGRNSPWDIK